MSFPAVHSVQFYEDDEALIRRLQSIVKTSLDSGSSALIVATQEHRHQLVSALRESGVNPVKSGQRLQMLDARETLDKFMVHGRPNRQRFMASVGKLLSRATEAAVNQHRGLMVFGEMVAVLWSDSNRLGALELERLWNELLHEGTFHLHCAYPRWTLDGNHNDLTMKSICDEHSAVLGFAKHLQSTVPSPGFRSTPETEAA